MSDYSEKGIPVVMPKDMINGKITEENIARVTDNHVKRLNRYIISSGNILYARRGDVGKCVYVSEKESGWLCGTGCLRININTAIANPKFVFFQLQKTETIGWVEKNAVGATMLNLNTSILANVPLHLPPLPTQQKIASVLSAYDDLIENNRKQIKLLEEAALKLYKEWFVKLNFPGHENTKIADGVPDGWKKEKISDWCRVFTGKKNANQNVEKGVYPFFTCAPDPLLSNDSLYEGKAVIISGNGSYTGRTQFYDGHFDLYQRTYACVKQKAVGYEYMPFIYYSMKVLFEPIKMGGTKGAAIPYIVMNDITDTEFLYNEEICKKYSGFAEITLDKIGALKKQIQLLQLARDKLLPKLMNGEIEV